MVPELLIIKAMKNLFLLWVLFPFAVFAQGGNFWNTLAEVHFQSTKDARGYEIEKPVFSKNLKTFHGKTIRLKGYLIPLEETGGKGTFMLSALPFNVCYFCGAAGPETVVELEPGLSLKFSTRSIVLEGKLFLNDTDPDHHIYLLKSVKLIP